MAHDYSCSKVFRILILTFTVCILGILGMANNLHAQSFDDLQISETPLILKPQGTSVVVCERVRQILAQIGGFLPHGHITIYSLYLRSLTPWYGQ